MRDYRDAKAMARTLRQALNAKSMSFSHSESLELVAKLLGFHDWNVLAAKIQTPVRAPAGASGTPVPQTPSAAVPTIPLRDLVLFPYMLVPIFVGRDTSKRAVERAFATDSRIFAVAQKRADDDNPTPDGLYRFGVTTRLLDQATLKDGTLKVSLQALGRASVLRFDAGEFLAAEVTEIPEPRGKDGEAASLSRAALDAYQTYANVDLAAPPQVLTLLPRLREPGMLADTLAQLLRIGMDGRQELLETVDPVARLEKVLALMKTDQEAA
jgi:ATP-dependent Lon protease